MGIILVLILAAFCFKVAMLENDNLTTTADQFGRVFAILGAFGLFLLVMYLIGG